MAFNHFTRYASPTAYRKGEVPRYLRELKLKNQELLRIEAEIDVNCPPGHVGLTEDERHEALEFANLSMFTHIYWIHCHCKIYIS